MPIVSIIVPVYKVEPFLSECIESILSQTYSDWELLLIDDGSPDNSGKICEDYALKDKRIRVFHKHNGGVSSARNLGLDNMTGEWVMFVDADDAIAPNTLKICINQCIKENLDLLQFSYTRVKKYNGHNGKKTIPMCLGDYIKKNQFLVCAGASLLRTSIIKENSLYFDTHLKLAEDQLFMYQYMDRCKVLQKIDDELYWYRDNLMSASRNQKSVDMEKSIPILVSYKILHPHWTAIIDKVNAMFLVDIIINNDRSLDQVSSLIKSANITSLSLLTGSYRIFGVVQLLSHTLAILLIKMWYNL